MVLTAPRITRVGLIWLLWNHFLHRPFAYLSDWFYGLSEHLMFLFWSTARFICIHYYFALSRFSNALKIIAFSFHFISCIVLFFVQCTIVFFSFTIFSPSYGYKFNKTVSDLESAIYGQVCRPDSYFCYIDDSGWCITRYASLTLSSIVVVTWRAWHLKCRLQFARVGSYSIRHRPV